MVRTKRREILRRGKRVRIIEREGDAREKVRIYGR